MTAYDEVTQHRVVPVIVAHEASSAEPLVDALRAGGLPVAEVTLRTGAALRIIAAMAKHADLVVGAGTVLTPRQVDEAVDAGAAFVVSPGLSRAVVERALERGVLPVPGVATASELQVAYELGLELVKFFPAEAAGGVAAVQSLSAPFAGIRFLPSGGVGPHNVAAYLACPAVAAVGGSWMVPPELVSRGDVAGLASRIAAAVELVSPGATPTAAGTRS